MDTTRNPFLGILLLNWKDIRKQRPDLLFFGIVQTHQPDLGFTPCLWLRGAPHVVWSGHKHTVRCIRCMLSLRSWFYDGVVAAGHFPFTLRTSSCEGDGSNMIGWFSDWLRASIIIAGVLLSHVSYHNHYICILLFSCELWKTTCTIRAELLLLVFWQKGTARLGS